MTTSNGLYEDAGGGLAGLLNRVVRRWRIRGALEALMVAVAVLATVAASAAWLIESARFEADVVQAARWLLAALALVATVVLATLGLVRRMDRQQAARYVERRVPALDGVLLTAAAGAREARGGGLWSGVADHAVAACRRLDAIDGVERTRLRRAARALVALLVLCAAALLLAPAGLRHAAGLLVPWNDPHAAIPYRIEVSPGTLTVVAGSDLRVQALMDGFRPRQAVLDWRTGDDAGWRSLDMLATEEGGFEALVFDLGTSIEYRVQAEGVSSATHRVTVLPPPAVERIDLTYHYPRASGRAPQTFEDGGPIAAVRGTRVTLRVLPRAPVVAGRLVVDDQQRLTLAAGDDGAWRADIELERDGHYRVEFDAGDGRFSTASAEYPITAHVDTPPLVRIRRPGRDTQATSIEELEVEVSARDDVIVRDLELVLSVNGGADEILRLGDPAGAPTVVASEILRLEERALEPGDLVAFHARAADGEGEVVNRASSDLYFLEIRPFDRVYRSAEGGGGGGGAGGGDQQQAGLAEQQRELVVALFNVQRDGAPDEQTMRERSSVLTQAQARVRDRTEAIVRRLGTRTVVEMNPGYRAMAAELPVAVSAMLRVEALLTAREIGAALEPAREALRHLQRADAAFREVQVARQSGGGQGQAGAAEAGDLANLFALEMDRFRSQYAGVERGRWQQPGDAELDAIAEQLRQLAERQLREVERLRQRRQQAASAAGAAASQQALEAEIERLERELQRLSLQRPEQQAVADARNRAGEAARAMREAGEAGSDAAAREALDKLEAARRALQGADGERLAEGVEQAQGRADRLAREQRALSDTVAAGEPGEALLERKDAIAARLDELAAQVQQLANEARDDSAVAGRALRDAADRLGGERLRNDMRGSRARLARDPRDVDPRVEADIATALEAARERLATAAASLGDDGAGASREADPAERLASLVRELESAERRLAEGDGRSGQSTAGGDQGGDQGGNEQAASGDAGGTSGGGAGGSAGGVAGGAAIGGGAWAGGIAAGMAGAGVGNLAPFRGNVAAQARELDRLRRTLPPDSGMARDIEAVVAGLLDIADDELASPSHALERHAELLARLRRVRDALAAAADQTPPALLARGQERAPAGWEAVVEAYFRMLADRPN